MLYMQSFRFKIIILFVETIKLSLQIMHFPVNQKIKNVGHSGHLYYIFIIFMKC